MNNFDHYAAAHDLIFYLDGEGYTTEAAAIKAAIEEGATGTEIFMALRFHLSEIVRRVPLTDNVRTLALKLLAELDDALQ